MATSLWNSLKMNAARLWGGGGLMDQNTSRAHRLNNHRLDCGGLENDEELGAP